MVQPLADRVQEYGQPEPRARSLGDTTTFPASPAASGLLSNRDPTAGENTDLAMHGRSSGERSQYEAVCMLLVVPQCQSSAGIDIQAGRSQIFFL